MQDTVKTFSTSYGEFPIDIIADAKMAAVFARNEYHQKDTVELLSAFVTPESVFVDGGAHIGTIAIPLSRKVAHTIAYEADAYTCTILQQNIERNDVEITVHQKGLGAKIGRGEMVSVREGNAGAHSLSVGEGRVDIVTLDDDLEGFDTLKFDVEGMELAVLQGAVRIVAEKNPVILFEVNLSQLRIHHTSLHALDAFFRTRNYRLYLPFHGTLVLGSVSSISLLALLMYPGAYLFYRTSSVFDLLALPKGKSVPLPVVSTIRTIGYVINKNLRNKMYRLRKIFL